MKLLGASKVTTHNKVTLVKEVVERLKIRKGDYILFYEKDGEIIIRKG